MAGGLSRRKAPPAALGAEDEDADASVRAETRETAGEAPDLVLAGGEFGGSFIYPMGDDLVTVGFVMAPTSDPSELVVRVVDEGEGFDPEGVADPLAPENILKSSGRGIFFMRNFMDDVTLRRVEEGGMEVRMVKKLAAGG